MCITVQLYSASRGGILDKMRMFWSCSSLRMCNWACRKWNILLFISPVSKELNKGCMILKVILMTCILHDLFFFFIFKLLTLQKTLICMNFTLYKFDSSFYFTLYLVSILLRTAWELLLWIEKGIHLDWLLLHLMLWYICKPEPIHDVKISLQFLSFNAPYFILEFYSYIYEGLWFKKKNNSKGYFWFMNELYYITLIKGFHEYSSIFLSTKFFIFLYISTNTSLC